MGGTALRRGAVRRSPEPLVVVPLLTGEPELGLAWTWPKHWGKQVHFTDGKQVSQLSKQLS